MQYREHQRCVIERRRRDVVDDEFGANVPRAALARGVNHSVYAVDADVADVGPGLVRIEKFLRQHAGRRAELDDGRALRQEKIAEAAGELVPFVVQRDREADMVVELAGDALEGPPRVPCVNVLSYLGHLTLPLAA